MITEDQKLVVENATVTITALGGRGVLVKGRKILTAAHCIRWSISGSIVLGAYFIEEIETKNKAEHKVTPYAIEPVYDIAALGSLDNQEFYEEVEQYELFCKMTKPVPISRKRLKEWDIFPIYVYTHTEEWIQVVGKTFDGPIAGFFADWEKNIEAGTSGSPIIDEFGKLVGIMSNAGGETGISKNGTAPFPYSALPGWIIETIK